MSLFCLVFRHFQFHTEVLSLEWSFGYWECGVHVKYIFHLKIWVLSRNILVNFGVSRMGRPHKIWGSYQKRRSTLEASSPLTHCYDWTRFLHLVIYPFLFACRKNQLKQGAQQKYGIALPQFLKVETFHDMNTKMIFDHNISVFLLLNSIGKNEQNLWSELWSPCSKSEWKHPRMYVPVDLVSLSQSDDVGNVAWRDSL